MEEPSSPGLKPVKLRDCMEDLLKFTLQSHASQTLTLNFDLELSVEYCSALLREDPHGPAAPASSLPGVSAYPLYKHLAMTLAESIQCGAMISNYKKVKLFDEEDGANKMANLDKLITEKGTELLNILERVDFEIHVQEPFFTQLKDGNKTVEGRCATGNYNRVASGDLILVNKCLALEVKDVIRYSSFHEMLEAESLSKVLPGVDSIDEGVQIYRKFYTEKKEISNGVLAIRVSKSLLQPYISLARILSSLSYQGVQNLLGFVHTAGTVSKSLPPPRSALLSAFQTPYNPDVKSSTLTDGARSLAKHCSRSSDKYWGCLDGSDSGKNKSAMDIITLLTSSCCWLNLHIVPPHGVVFEIRVADGYGARWSEDGSKFIGFLEPYTKDGHLKRWRH